MIEDAKMEGTISGIVEKIKDDYKPEKIILFGSYAYGSPSEESDIDLLVVKDSTQRRDERDKEIKELLKEIKIPLDIFVYTSKEVEKFCTFRGSFINKILSNGEVLYER